MRPESEREAVTAEVAEAVAAFVDRVIADAVDGEVVRVLGTQEVADGFVVQLVTAERISDPGSRTRSTCSVRIDRSGRILDVDREPTT